MRYMILPALWEKLTEDERSLRWLGRKAQVDPSLLSLIQNGKRGTVNESYAERISAVFDCSVDAFFRPHLPVNCQKTSAKLTNRRQTDGDHP